ncbi:MAG: DnaJ domain-containing protein [Chloroflexota bacterium]|nr:DnaJ domain-containing protein [Chloroflexota bacterium]
MVLPILYGLGARDFVDLLGYVVDACPACRATSVFAVYQSKRKVTFYTLPTFSVREQQVIECRSCGARFAVPPELRESFAERLMTQEEVAARVGRNGTGGQAGNGAAKGPTLYQILQVDPAADPEVIEAAFRRLALKYHPDRSTVPNAAERMRELLEAKACLSDPARRSAYDATLGIVRRPPAMRPEEV